MLINVIVVLLAAILVTLHEIRKTLYKLEKKRGCVVNNHLT